MNRSCRRVRSRTYPADMATLCTHPVLLEELFLADPEVHLYGLPDLEEPFWSLSSYASSVS